MEGELKNQFKKLNFGNLLSKIIPKLNPKSKKGSNGVTAVIGGSLEYTGAPYYSAISSLKSGSDISHIFCHKEAAIPIKSYSPELIVHPAFEDKKDKEKLDKLIKRLETMDSLVIGCGLGREEAMRDIIQYLLENSLKIENLPHIIDADGIWFFMNIFKSIDIKDKKLVLTPNNNEFIRLYNKVLEIKEDKSEDSKKDDTIKLKTEMKDDSIEFLDWEKGIYELELEKSSNLNLFAKEIELANKLNNLIIIKKGVCDVITNGKRLAVINNAGALKRTGGLGDILTGVISTFAAMIKKNDEKEGLTNDNLFNACITASYLNRLNAENAFKKHGFALTAPDVITEISEISRDYSSKF